MKQSFTYSGEAKTKKGAMKRAKKEGIKNFSDLVEGLLKAYASPTGDIELSGATKFYAKKF